VRTMVPLVLYWAILEAAKPVKKAVFWSKNLDHFLTGKHLNTRSNPRSAV
jgi:hypothetical protein